MLILINAVFELFETYTINVSIKLLPVENTEMMQLHTSQLLSAHANTQPAMCEDVRYLIQATPPPDARKHTRTHTLTHVPKALDLLTYM